MADNCIFCQIAAGQKPGSTVYQDERVTALRDLHPAAPVHLLIIPNRHIASLDEAVEEDQALLGHLLLVARRLAEQEGLHPSGYRVMINTGPDAGQSVFHLHLHLMGGQKLPGFVR